MHSTVDQSRIIIRQENVQSGSWRRFFLPNWCNIASDIEISYNIIIKIFKFLIFIFIQSTTTKRELDYFK